MDAIVIRVLLFALAGLLIGSFLTVVIERVPSGGSIVRPRSRCPKCGTTLRARDNIPVVSYLLLRGRCRTCGGSISPLYPLTELATGTLFAGAAARFDRIPVVVLVAPFLGLMLALAVIDARRRVLPNRIVYPAVVLFAVYVLAVSLAGGGVRWVSALVGMAGFGGTLLVVALISPRGMGMGDVKLAGLIGLVLGALGGRYVLVAAALGVLFGGLGALAALVVGRRGRKQTIPFGPFLAAGAVAAAFWAPQVSNWYLSLIN